MFGEGVYRLMRKQMVRQPESGTVSKMKTASVKLTEREKDVIRLVAQGYDNREISKELFLAEGTVRNQISRLLEKLSLKDRTQLAVYAVKQGLDE